MVHAYLFGKDRMVPLPAVILLFVIVAASLLISNAIRGRLTDEHPDAAEKYGLDSSLPKTGIGYLMLSEAFIWGGAVHSLNDATMVRLVWSARAAQLLFILALAATWFLSA